MKRITELKIVRIVAGGLLIGITSVILLAAFTADEEECKNEHNSGSTRLYVLVMIAVVSPALVGANQIMCALLGKCPTCLRRYPKEED